MRASPNLTEPDGSISFRAQGEHVAWDLSAIITENLRWRISCCQTANSGWRSTASTVSGLTGLPACCTWITDWDASFTSYDNYFDGGQDEDAIAYLTLANKLIHQVNPAAISIAEEMSGMPGLAAPVKDGGMGFNFRLSMGIPDYWIKIIKERADEQWNTGEIYHELINKRSEEKTISYAESHDQALVGDKTIAFRLMDKEMYYCMDKGPPVTDNRQGRSPSQDDQAYYVRHGRRGLSQFHGK
jgi:hypothetical protein